MSVQVLCLFSRGRKGFTVSFYLILNIKENQPTFGSELYPFGNGTGVDGVVNNFLAKGDRNQAFICGMTL